MFTVVKLFLELIRIIFRDEFQARYKYKTKEPA